MSHVKHISECYAYLALDFQLLESYCLFSRTISEMNFLGLSIDIMCLLSRKSQTFVCGDLSFGVH